MTQRPGKVRPLRPMRVVLVTDDSRYADEMVSSATHRGITATVVSTAADVDATAAEFAANVVVFDAEKSVAGMTRRATAFAALHPRIAVGLITVQGLERNVGNVRLFDKWRSVERLLGELERVYLGLRILVERDESSSS
jgi:hypothetical protein